MICEQKNIKYRKDRLFFKRLRYSTLRFSTWKIWQETNQWFHIDSRLKGRLVGPLKLLLKKWFKRIESSSIFQRTLRVWDNKSFWKLSLEHQIYCSTVDIQLATKKRFIKLIIRDSDTKQLRWFEFIIKLRIIFNKRKKLLLVWTFVLKSFYSYL